LAEIINTANTDDVSAFITSSYISHTYKVESTHSIVNLWDNFRKKIKLNNNLDYVSALLALGRMLDVKKEIGEERYIQELDEVRASIIEELTKRDHTSNLTPLSFVSALITSACISRTEEIETVNEIVNQWENVNKSFKIQNDIDILAGILTIGRINEYKYSMRNIEQIVEVHEKLKEHIQLEINDRTIELSDYGAALLTAAYLEITPKIERVADMVNTWAEFQRSLVIDDNIDYISSILASGRVRDLDAQFFLTGTNVFDIKNSIRNLIETKN
jgi:hypothetical protein